MNEDSTITYRVLGLAARSLLYQFHTRFKVDYSELQQYEREIIHAEYHRLECV